MRSVGSLEWILWVLSMGASAVLLIRLAWERIAGNYRYFAAMLALDLVRSLALLWFRDDRNAYAITYVVFEPALWLLYVLIVLQLLDMSLQRHPALAAAARWVTFLGVGVAVVVALSRLPFDFSNPNETYPWLLMVRAMRGAVVTAMVLLLAVIAGFLAWFPVPLSRNAAVYTFGLAVYFLAHSITLLARNLFGVTLTRSMSTVALGVAAACLIAWAILLTARGEQVSVTVGHSWNREKGQHLLAQLQAMNDTLRRPGRQ
jgi:hypothetical protein